jgi:tetratricopeptide (TPR) repeat protein
MVNYFPLIVIKGHLPGQGSPRLLLRFGLTQQLALIICLCGLFFSGLAQAGGTLSNVLVSKQGGQVALEARFACSFRYSSHEPRGYTQQVDIELIPVGQCPGFKTSEALQEMQRPSGSDSAGLSQVEFSVRGGQVTLSIRFTTPMRATVTQPAGLRSMRIAVVPYDTSLAVTAAAGPGAQVEESAEASVSSASSTPAPPMPRMRVHKGEQSASVGGAFVINLQTAKDTPAIVSDAARVNGKQLYISALELKGVEWQSLRVGFFSSEGRAEAALQKVKTDYPDALVVRVAESEYQIAAANPVKQLAVDQPVLIPGVQVDTTGLSDGRLAELMSDARREMLAGNYPAAIQIYTKVLREGDTRYAPEALEYLGLARERNGQQAHAVSEYRRYLALYPSEAGVPRVEQRLDGVLVTDLDEFGQLPRAVTRNERSRSNWDVYGGISQYYRRDVINFDGEGSQTTQSAVLSDIDLITRRQGKRFDVATRMTFGNYYDLLSEDEGSGNDTRFYYMYLDLADRDTGVSTRLGRQTLNTSGVLGRFDGAHVAWQFSPDWRVNFMTGEPVYSASNSPDSDRSFYGVSVDTFDIADLFDASVYYNAQEVDGIDDREAVGGELRYYDTRTSLVSLLDYDIGYNTLNSFTALGNFTFDNRLTLNATFDYRRSPYLLTENALVGQGIGTIDELRELFSESEIRDLAEARSGDVTTVTLGFSRPVFERFQINADITASDFSGTPASLNVAETPGLGTEYYYNVNLVGSSLMSEGDTSIFSVRYADGNTASTTSFSLDTRYPLTDRLRINPRLLVSYRDFSTSDSKEVVAVPALRLFYELQRHTRLEFEFGARLSDRDTDSGSFSSTSWFLYTGYRTDF